MPTSKEITSNTPLAGHELSAIIKRDISTMLDRDGMFQSHIAFKRVSYTVTIKLHLDIPEYPEHVTRLLSRPASINQIKENPSLATLEPPPLDPKVHPLTEDMVLGGMERTRTIDSPNIARIENDLPITVMSTDPHNGQMVERQIHYDKDGLPESGSVVDKTITDQMSTRKEDWDV